MSKSVGEFGEFALIERWTRPWRGRRRLIIGGLGEDAALLPRTRGREGVVSTDLMVEGIHFDRRWMRGEDVGWKLLARGLSDLASVGATPTAFLVSAALPRRTPVSFVDGVYDGLRRLASSYGIPLIGGDTAHSHSRMTFDIVVVGSVQRRHYVSRAGARPGDRLYVTGTLGDAALALRLLKGGMSRWQLAKVAPRLLRKFLRPLPRIAWGEWAGCHGVRSMIDISDGLLSDLGHILEASGVGAVVLWDQVPRSREFKRWTDPRSARTLALAGGDDYELLMVAPLGKRLRQRGVASIGWLTDRPGHIEIMDRLGKPLALPPLPGYKHFL